MFFLIDINHKQEKFILTRIFIGKKKTRRKQPARQKGICPFCDMPMIKHERESEAGERAIGNGELAEN